MDHLEAYPPCPDLLCMLGRYPSSTDIQNRCAAAAACCLAQRVQRESLHSNQLLFEQALLCRAQAPVAGDDSSCASPDSLHGLLLGTLQVQRGG